MTDYLMMEKQLRALLHGRSSAVSCAANMSALIYGSMDGLNWAGFYFLQPDGRLELGPFQGKPACMEIDRGKGVCGAAAECGQTVRVEDVHAFPGHIACDSASRSEIVVPVFLRGELFGVLDIDSPLESRFSAEDQEGLELLVRAFEEELASASVPEGCGLRQTVERLAMAAGRIIRTAAADKCVEEKSSRHDLVTKYDRQVQDFLRCGLREAFPQAVFIGEEDGLQTPPDDGMCFIVDPIDGTTNFTRNRNRSCVSIGCMINGEIILGAVYDPYRDELFSAEKGKGSVCNGKRIRTAQTPLSQALCLVGMPAYCPEKKEKLFAMKKELLDICTDIRTTGSAALDLCDVACGRADAYLQVQLCPWDYAAGSLILSEAGGISTTLEGKPLAWDRKCSLAASGSSCRGELMALVGKYYGEEKQL